MEEIELKIYDMSSTLQPANAYALVLVEKDGSRKLPVIIGALEAQSIKIAMSGFKMPRPLTHDLLMSLAKGLDISITKAVIYRVEDGIYYSYIYFDNKGEEIKLDARTSDAIALALRSGAPIYTTKEIMDNEHLREESNGSFSITINLVNLSVLKEELAKAIEEENYEQAAKLRDEIKRREKIKKSK